VSFTYTVLLVDDDSHVREGLRDFMQWDELGVSKVVEACDGVEALEKVKEIIPHVVITDVRMPGMDGIELARQISDTAPEIKVILLTAYSEFSYAQQAISYGVVDYILKPTNLEKLSAAVKRSISELDRQRSIKDRLRDLDHPERPQDESDVPGVTHRIIAKTRDFIFSHYNEALKLATIAQHVHCNASYLSRLYKKELGETITDTITHLRIQKAEELLRHTDLKAYEIADHVGWEDAAYFSIVFKKYTGKSPKQYRQDINSK